MQSRNSLAGSKAFGKITQCLNRHRYNIGHAPGGRHPYRVICPLEGLGEDVPDDRRDPALAIDDGRSGRAVIDDEAVVAFVHFDQRHAGELAGVPDADEGFRSQCGGARRNFLTAMIALISRRIEGSSRPFAFDYRVVCVSIAVTSGRP
jgi:hypothetical protein